MSSPDIDFKRIFSQSAQNPCVILDPAFRILAINRLYQEHFGLAEADCLGCCLPDCLLTAEQATTKEQARLKAALETVLDTRDSHSMPLDFMSSRPAGPGTSQARYWQCVNQPVVGDDGKVMYILHQFFDITDRLPLKHGHASMKNAGKSGSPEKQALMESERRLQAIFRDASVGITVCDLKGRFLDANPTFLDMLGYTLDELRELTYLDVTHPDERQQSQSEREKIVMRESPFTAAEKRYVTKAGNVVWARISNSPLLDENGNFESLIAITEDTTAKKEAELIYNREEQLNRVAGELATVGGWANYFDLKDPSKNEVYWSPSTRSILEYEGDEVPSKGIHFSHFYPDTRDRALECFDQCFTGGRKVDFEAHIRTYKDNEKWIRIIGEPRKNASGKVDAILGVIQDVTDIKKSEQEKQLISNYLVNTLEYMKEAFYLLDRDWNFLFVNREALSIFKRTREELIGKNIWEEFPSLKSNAEMYDLYCQAMTSGQPVHQEFYSRTLEHWVETSLHPTPEGLAVYFTITTEKRALQAEIIESEQRLKFVTQATLDVAWDVNLETDLLWVSKGINEYFGHNVSNTDAIPFRFWQDNVHPEDIEEWSGRFMTYYHSDRSQWSHRYRFRRGDDSYAHVEDRGFIIRNDEGQAIRMVGGTFDITEQLELEEQLRQSQRLESVGKLTGGVAHDFNNLLTIILGNIGLLAEILSHDENGKSLAGNIEKATLQGAELTQRLLAFARKQALDPKVINPNQLIENMYGLLKRTLGEDIDIRIQPYPEANNVMVDPHQLENAIINLCINSRDAMPEGGELGIDIRELRVDSSNSGQFPDLDIGNYVHLAVSDSGKGIPENLLDRIIEPFFTTKEAGKGTGLGLSTVFGFIKQSRGHMTVESEPGAGTTINLYLPATIEQGKQEEKDRQDSLMIGGNEVILVVEDDRMVLDVARQTLDALGYKVITCNNGEDALAVLESGQKIDLLFTDIVMPGKVKGNVLAEKAAAIQPGIKVLLTSGYSDDVFFDKDDAREKPLLRKPYMLNDLARKVREVIETMH